MVQEPIKHGADGGDIAEQLAPVLDGTIGCEQRAETLVAAHDDLQQILGGRMWEFAHAEVIDDKQRNGRHRFHELFASAVCNCLGQFIEHDVGFTIEHAVALQDDSLSDGLRQVTFPRPSRTEKQSVLSFVDEGAGGEVEDQTPIHLGIEGEVEVVERAVGIAEAGLFAAAFKQPVGAARELV